MHAGPAGRLTQVVLVPVRGGGVGQGAEVGGWPGAPALRLCLVQILQELRRLVQVQVAVVCVKLLLHFPCANMGLSDIRHPAAWAGAVCGARSPRL